MKLVIELDGGQHNEKDSIARDRQRDAFLEGEGFMVLRFWNNDVFTNIDGVLEKTLDTARTLAREKELKNKE